MIERKIANDGLSPFSIARFHRIWQGGFMFYGGVVVPTGAAVLGSEVEQGFITQSVTNYLNLAGGVCAVLWGLTLWLDARPPLLKRD